MASSSSVVGQSRLVACQVRGSGGLDSRVSRKGTISNEIRADKNLKLRASSSYRGENLSTSGGKRRSASTHSCGSTNSGRLHVVAASPPTEDVAVGAEPLTKQDLVAYLASGCKPKEKWRCVFIYVIVERYLLSCMTGRVRRNSLFYELCNKRFLSRNPCIVLISPRRLRIIALLQGCRNHTRVRHITSTLNRRTSESNIFVS
jgi:hypothetical protein